MTDTTVKFYRSTMAGAPTLSGVAGSLIGVIDACIAGFGTVTLDSLTVASGIATATKSAGHGFASVGNYGPVVLIAGATPAGLNGEWRIIVDSATQFRFACAGVADGSASGTITAKIAPLAWTKAYSGTNKAAYKSADPLATGMLWRLDDSTAQYAAASGYETMSGIDAGTSFSTGKYVIKSNTADSTARAWAIVSNGRMLYLFTCDGANTNYFEPHYFGEYNYANPVFTYNVVHAGTIASTSRANSLNPLKYEGAYESYYNNNIVGRITLARAHGGGVGGVNGSFSAYGQGYNIGFLNSSEGWPSTAVGLATMVPIQVWYGGPSGQLGSLFYGTLPGAFAGLGQTASGGGLTYLTGEEDFFDVPIGYATDNSGHGRILIKLQGPW